MKLDYLGRIKAVDDELYNGGNSDVAPSDAGKRKVEVGFVLCGRNIFKSYLFLTFIKASHICISTDR